MQVSLEKVYIFHMDDRKNNFEEKKFLAKIYLWKTLFPTVVKA
jgi:hypothetical protein